MTRGRRKGDHDTKRLEIAEAACEAILKLGVARASLVDIARELGYSTGVLRHYFTDKEDLLLFAKNMLFDRALTRAQAAAEQHSGVGKLYYMGVELLALDESSLDRQRLLTTFNGYAIGDVRLMRIQHKRNERSSLLFQRVIEELQREGALSSQLNPRVEALGIMAFIDGLDDQVTMKADAYSPADMLALYHRHIESLREGRLPSAPSANKTDRPLVPRKMKRRANAGRESLIAE